ANQLAISVAIELKGVWLAAQPITCNLSRIVAFVRLNHREHSCGIVARSWFSPGAVERAPVKIGFEKGIVPGQVEQVKPDSLLLSATGPQKPGVQMSGQTLVELAIPIGIAPAKIGI